jgi:hypothetical protein
MLNQGNPWEPWIIGYSLGDNTYRRTDRPMHPSLNLVNQEGAPQTLQFEKVNDVFPATKTIELRAAASSGLKVQFFVVSGPVHLGEDGHSLVVLPIPKRSKYPIRVLIGAYQWGRVVDPKVQSAGPVVQEFFIQRPRD